MLFILNNINSYIFVIKIKSISKKSIFTRLIFYSLKMKLKFSLIVAVVLGCFFFQNCDDINDNTVPDEISVNDFIWKGLNSYYLWQEDVSNLTDDLYYDQKKLNDFLYNYSDPQTLFVNLLNKPASLYANGEAIDRFSFIYSDYTKLEGVLTGNTLNNGVDFGLKYKSGSSTEIFGWVRYIIPNSDASKKNINRGDLFYAVNGTPLTTNNYQSLLFGSDNEYVLNLADYNNGEITPNGKSVSLTKTNLSENPVLMSSIIENGNHKIGYLVYNAFYSSYETQLNNAFGEFKSQGITDLVLDLRYNSGGSVDTANRLASMITGQFTGQVFAKEQWNSKVEKYYNSKDASQFYNYFTNVLGNKAAINHLNLNTIYVLTTKSTASASELVINGLIPYINVIQIGDATTGKNVGSITIYDSPTYKKKDLNPNHKYAMQPLVLKIVNKSGYGDYINGLPPNILLKENLGNLGILGNPSEPLLNAAINSIIGAGKSIRQENFNSFNDFIDNQSINRLKNEMYINEIPQLNP